MADTDAWYPAAEKYWVPAHEAHEYPLRYGDLCATPDLDPCRTSKGKPWTAVVILHPSCEMGAKAKASTAPLVARVNQVDAMSQPQRPAVRTGWVERGAVMRVAHANTFWMPPAPGGGGDDLYANFREVVCVPLDELARTAAMTHDARVYLVRREIYFKYRWLVSVDEVQDNEAGRIRNDPSFEGPRPPWGTP